VCTHLRQGERDKGALEAQDVGHGRPSHAPEAVEESGHAAREGEETWALGVVCMHGDVCARAHMVRTW